MDCESRVSSYWQTRNPQPATLNSQLIAYENPMLTIASVLANADNSMPSVLSCYGL